MFTGEPNAGWGRRRALLDLRSVHPYIGRHSRLHLHQDLQHSTPTDLPHHSGQEGGRSIRPAHLGMAHTVHSLTILRAHDPNASHALRASATRGDVHTKLPPRS